MNVLPVTSFSFLPVNTLAATLLKQFLSILLKPIVPYRNDNLASISERFIDMYNQALTSEHNQNYELAAIGYRSALEILVKDYAIQELNEPEETVSKKSLCDAIAKYLSQPDLVATADVVRILAMTIPITNGSILSMIFYY